MAENFAEGYFQCSRNDLHSATKSADFFISKGGRVLDNLKLPSEIEDLLHGAGVQLLSLERDLLRDLILVNPSAVSRGY